MLTREIITSRVYYREANCITLFKLRLSFCTCSLLLYGFFHNGTFVSGAIGVDTLPHNFHFLTESVARDVLVEDYTRTLLQSALGSSIDYSVQGATIASPTTSSPGPVGLSDAGIAGIVVATVIMTLIFASGIGLVIALLVK